MGAGPIGSNHNNRSTRVWVNAQRASLLTMAQHELAANAVKYGPLSDSYGVASADHDARPRRL
jgi:two-component sensor histidine kinase